MNRTRQPGTRYVRNVGDIHLTRVVRAQQLIVDQSVGAGRNDVNQTGSEPAPTANAYTRDGVIRIIAVVKALRAGHNNIKRIPHKAVIFCVLFTIALLLYIGCVHDGAVLYIHLMWRLNDRAYAIKVRILC